MILWLLPILLFGKSVVVSIPPQKFIVDQISGGAVETVVLLPKAASPVTYSPRPSDLALIKRSSLYLTIGVPFEKAYRKRIKGLNPDLIVTDMARYVRKFPITHHGGENHNGELDPHVWLAPPLLTLLARATLQDLLKIAPEHRTIFLANYARFIEQIGVFDAKMYGRLLGLSTRKFVVYHPSFGYFARLYDLDQVVIEREGKEPSAKHLASLLKEAKGAKLLVLEPQFPKRSANFIAKKLGLWIISIDPLEYDIFKTVEQLVNGLQNYSR